MSTTTKPASLTRLKNNIVRDLEQYADRRLSLSWLSSFPQMGRTTCRVTKSYRARSARTWLAIRELIAEGRAELCGVHDSEIRLIGGKS